MNASFSGIDMFLFTAKRVLTQYRSQGFFVLVHSRSIILVPLVFLYVRLTQRDVEQKEKELESI